MLKASFHSRTFTFGFAARTSRGAMREKKSWFIRLWDDALPAVCGWGECGPLPGLSPETFDGLAATLAAVVEKINGSAFKTTDFAGADFSLSMLRKALDVQFGAPLLAANSSLVFGLETAFLDLAHGGRRMIFDNGFYSGVPIPINGLVWMGGLDFMLQQVEFKIREGFSCIKLKVGGMDFERECDILQYIRRKHFRLPITLRVDANGAFKPFEALEKIRRMGAFEIHSIEQPLAPGSPDLPDLCRNSPVPIALDEELTGVHNRTQKTELLERIRPAFLILKPMLHGGLSGCSEWIELAEERGIGWWITSALESAIGLNAVSQFTAQFDVKIHQGLGTGSIYTNPIGSPLEVKTGFLSYNSTIPWDEIVFN